VFTEDDWSIADSPDTDAYARSKTLAERAAWEFAASTPAMAFTSINPSMVMGPPLDSDVESSAEMVLMFLRGRYPLVPDYGIEMVDVRDVAEAHLRAIETSASHGQRFIVSSNAITMREMGRLLAREFPAYASRMPRATLPHLASRLLAHVNKGLRQVAADLGPAKRTSTRAARDVLDMRFRSAEEAVTAMAECVIRWGLA
jgi:dihydroflavonol-4-reductase